MTQTSDRGWHVLGLDSVDERVVHALVEADASEATLASSLDLPVDEVRASLRRLATLGVVEAETEHYRATPPDNALGSLIAQVNVELAAIRSSAGHLQARYDAARAASGAAGLVEVVIGEERIVDRFSRLMASATSEVMAFVAPPFLAPGNYEEDEHDQLASGVRYRVVYAESAVEAQGGAVGLLESVSAGEEARVAADVPVKMFVVDRSSALVPLSLDAGPAAVLVSRFGLVDALVALFDLVWASSWPLEDFAEGSSVAPLSDRDRRLVGLMHAGYTDQAIARSLGVAVRTVARRLAALMRDTGATTRFQLGWRLAEMEATSEAERSD